MNKLATWAFSTMVILTSIWVATFSQTTDDEKLKSLLGDDSSCENACILGIEPGITTQSEVEAIFLTEGITYDQTNGASGQPIQPTLLGWQPPLSMNFSAGSGWISFDMNNVVSVIGYNTDNLDVATVTTAFGNPPSVLANGDNYYNLVYPHRNLLFDVNVTRDTNAVIGIMIRSDTEYDSFTNSLETVDEPCPNYGTPPCIAPTAIPNQAPVAAGTATAFGGLGLNSFTPPGIDPPPDDPTLPTLVDVSFDATASNDPDGSIVTYEWRYGTNTFYTGSDPTIRETFEFYGCGTITFYLTVTDDDGATDTIAVPLQGYSGFC